jgi:hypothetical protein
VHKNNYGFAFEDYVVIAKEKIPDANQIGRKNFTLHERLLK